MKPKFVGHGCCGALAWRMAAAGMPNHPVRWGSWAGGPSWCTVAVGRRQAVRLRPESPRPGRPQQTRPAPRRSRMNTTSVMARDELLPRRSAGGAAHKWWHLAWGATGRWWSPPSSAHLSCTAVADATLFMIGPETPRDHCNRVRIQIPPPPRPPTPSCDFVTGHPGHH